MAKHDDTSISPMTRSPATLSPSASSTNIPTAAFRHSGLRTELNTDGSTTTDLRPTFKDTSQPTTPRQEVIREADDYMNGGLPHESSGTPPPVASTEASAISRPSSIRQTSAAPSIRGNGALHSGTGTQTPPGRRSVQFARTDSGGQDIAIPARWDVSDADGDPHGKGVSLMSKLRALAITGGLNTNTHTRSKSTGNVQPYSGGSLSAPHSPTAERFGSSIGVPGTLEEEGSDADADAEQTADEQAVDDAARVKKKRRYRRPPWGSLQMDHSTSAEGGASSSRMRRRNTMPEDLDEPRGGVSEGEGRDRLGMGSAWRKGSSWVSGGRGHNYSGSNPNDINTTPGRRPLTLRRLTGMGGSDNEGQSPRRPFLGFDRAATSGAAARRWGVVKHGLKLLGQKKEPHMVDYKKSAELMAELRAGAPAALMLASMIQRDEHGNKRIPVLLEQLKLTITDSSTTQEGKAVESERHMNYRIMLEYGSGQNRMKWVIDRSLKDFLNLHLRYKLQASTDKYLQLRDIEHRPKQPKFPRTAFPYLRGVRGIGDSDEEGGDADTIRGDDTAGEATHSELDLPSRRRRQTRPGMGHRRRSSAQLESTVGMTAEEIATHAREAKRVYNERQRKKLEEYLQAMIRWLIFRADSNRLCKFLELSALGVRLAAEGSYHGKEGFLVIGTSKGIDFRRILTPNAIFARHTPKWFLVRHSYIVCVDSPENMHIYDVYLLDPKFEIVSKEKKLKQKIKDSNAVDMAIRAKTKATYPQHHRLKLRNSERRIDLLAKNERIMRQFQESIQFIMKTSLWSKPNRFDSFAPVRQGVYAQWLVDGRDYMWNVSRAINMAKDVIYIHDWWLSPQLYMRRPAAISQKWRLDRLLRKKAREGVKIFIIIYRNVEAAIPIDSEFTKFSMLDLHPNIFLQRSPNQFKKNQFFFAHHEKICIVDHTVAFVGGIDLCFGRWDTPQHSVCDDKPTGFEHSDEPKDADHCQLWPGKDYSNPRVQDFFQLNAPYAEMYDRSKTPRMPWHDVSMQVVGQPARDLTRHFVQRWNYVLRGRKPTRPTPFLLPPPDFNQSELESLGLNGTCEVQILRSASNWSLGIDETEHSIMNAYCKMIEESEHFVYMENQFFITSCETMNVKIVNKIGDAIVERAVRAYNNNENWRIVILIPLMPGFQNTVDAPDGTSVRLIMQCQFRSISRGENSIFGRLRNEGIEPEDFVSFYSLRAWGKIGPNKTLVTEQLYIHAKVIIVDDRIALIGSANINERSMLGSRDSECAAVVRDTDVLWSTMGGEPFQVGRFAHTLRMRLMREHIGVDVDDVMEEERRAELDREEEEFESRMDGVYDDTDDEAASGQARPARRRAAEAEADSTTQNSAVPSFNHGIDTDGEGNSNFTREHVTMEPHVANDAEVGVEDVEGAGPDRMIQAEKTGLARGRDSTLVGGREVLVTDIAPEGKGTLQNPKLPHQRVSKTVKAPELPKQPKEKESGNIAALPPFLSTRSNTEKLGLPQLSQLPSLPLVDDTDIGGPPVYRDPMGGRRSEFNPLTADITCAAVDKDCMRDPLNDTFFDDVWTRIAENNTKIFRRVFRCNPDNEVTNWHEYTEFQAYSERFAQSQGVKSEGRQEQESKGKSGPPGASMPLANLGALGETIAEKFGAGNAGDDEHPSGNVKEWADAADARHRALSNVDEKEATLAKGKAPEFDEKSPVPQGAERQTTGLDTTTTTRTTTFSAPPITNTTTGATEGGAPPPAHHGSTRARRRRGISKSKKGFSAAEDLLTREEAESMLDLVQGNLVVFPTEWLKSEEHNSNWLYQVDQVAPLQIYD
ncbi:hypothetical protein V495_05204 [Pseudogymnoascus sp. VKM F-4514 (FW-929)]|nr:hypothetical protein V495_05204 [Pseudogymnoascus sp. VKM F-4514 (FW-929)]KFY64250.1 hypothetical protein V497_01778 [Pseudogymnoascus sp. VKM F-4516 (FW-969)]